MTKQEIRGKTKKAKGKVKEAVGILSGDKKLEQKGARERTEGAFVEGVGMVRRRVGDLLSDIGDALKK
jgi:uncharacterized protein YjbJ (UPF0337 family)